MYFTANSLSFTYVECLSVIHTCVIREHVFDFSRANVIIDLMFNVLARDASRAVWFIYQQSV